ncbi:MAG: hypothetical protein EOP48_18815 [Sphingobacteriales bacterium]|nr:MAG: hypothetical protein EOP48_18815 [Sphingobacteriales bacterium]
MPKPLSKHIKKRFTLDVVTGFDLASMAASDQVKRFESSRDLLSFPDDYGQLFNLKTTASHRLSYTISMGGRWCQSLTLSEQTAISAILKSEPQQSNN